MTQNVTVKSGSSGSSILVAADPLADGSYAQKFIPLTGMHPDGVVLCDDDFTDSPDLHGWEQLYSATYNGVVGWDRGAMVLCVENGTGLITPAIKRLSYWDSFAVARIEAWMSLAPMYTVNANGDPKVRAAEIGFDQANNSGGRSYYSMRRVFTETDGTTFADRWEMKTGTDSVPTFTPFPGQGYPTTPIGGSDPAPSYDGVGPLFPVWPPNEGKRNRVYLALEVDLTNGTYHGARFNSRKLGSLSATELPSLAAFTGQTSTLARFSNGLNATIDFRGVLGASIGAGDLYVYRVRVTAA